jgi:hypothetical protein
VWLLGQPTGTGDIMTVTDGAVEQTKQIMRDNLAGFLGRRP